MSTETIKKLIPCREGPFEMSRSDRIILQSLFYGRPVTSKRQTEAPADLPHLERHVQRTRETVAAC